GGLVYAHAKGVTHRDIKLTNILISSQGNAKLVDFGLAKYFQASSKDDDKVERTVDYAGLEKATGVKPGDTRSDIYFLGCGFYQMLTGRPPLEMTRNKMARMSPHRFDKVVPIGRDEINAPPSIFHLVETMMALDPRSRYQTAPQLLDAIRSARRDVTVQQGGTPSSRTVFVLE